MKNLWSSFTACLLAVSLVLAVPLALTVPDDAYAIPPETKCDDGKDNDKDGDIDCADTDCAGDPVCGGGAVEICDNNVDDDGDNLIDCADPDCTTDPACAVSTAPILDPIGDKAISAGNTLTFTVTATDPTDPTPNLTFSSSTLPGNATFDTGTGVFNWQTGGNDVGAWPLTFTVTDEDLETDSESIIINVLSTQAGGPPKNAFNILMNYELGMHCTGFEFAYCCVLPPYNSILAQVVKTEKNGPKPRLLEADPNVGLDGMGRPTVLRDPTLNADGNFSKYQLRYWHEAQPRNDGRGAPQDTSMNRLISSVEGNSLLMWNTVAEGATTVGGALQYSTDPAKTDGSTNVVQGDGDFADANDPMSSKMARNLQVCATVLTQCP